MTDERLLSSEVLAEIKSRLGRYSSLHMWRVNEDVTALLADRDALAAENAELAVLLTRWQTVVIDQVLPRYGEMFEYLGLGNPSESVVWDLVGDLVRPTGEALAGRVDGGA